MSRAARGRTGENAIDGENVVLYDIVDVVAIKRVIETEVV
jgi:hypothetical protein